MPATQTKTQKPAKATAEPSRLPGKRDRKDKGCCC